MLRIGVKFLRIALIVGVLLGVGILDFELNSPPFDSVPFPGPGQYVRLPIRLWSGGTSKIDAAIPTGEHPLILDENPPIPCDLSVTIKSDAREISTQRVTSIARGGQFGYGHVDLYDVGNKFDLPAGEFTVVFEG